MKKRYIITVEDYDEEKGISIKLNDKEKENELKKQIQEQERLLRFYRKFYEQHKKRNTAGD